MDASASLRSHAQKRKKKEDGQTRARPGAYVEPVERLLDRDEEQRPRDVGDAVALPPDSRRDYRDSEDLPQVHGVEHLNRSSKGEQKRSTRWTLQQAKKDYVVWSMGATGFIYSRRFCFLVVRNTNATGFI